MALRDVTFYLDAKNTDATKQVKIAIKPADTELKVHNKLSDAWGEAWGNYDFGVKQLNGTVLGLDDLPTHADTEFIVWKTKPKEGN